MSFFMVDVSTLNKNSEMHIDGVIRSDNYRSCNNSLI